MTTETYRSRREQQRLSSLEPFTEEELDTIKAAQRDFWTFLNTVYAASFEGEEFLHSDVRLSPKPLRPGSFLVQGTIEVGAKGTPIVTQNLQGFLLPIGGFRHQVPHRPQ